MQLGTFTPRERTDGDSFPAKEAVDRSLIVLVREHRTGIVTKFKPEGGDGVVVDVADTATNSVWIDVLWMNGAVVDNLAPFLGQPVAVKLEWVASAKGGNSYISVAPLEGAVLAQATAWAAANTNRFDLERQQRAALANKPAALTPPAPAAPAAPAVALAPAPVQRPAPAAVTAPAPPVTGTVNVNDPAALQALLATIAAGQVQVPPAA
jgi:hypothetical protein